MRLRIVLTSILLLPSGLTVFRQLHLARREAGCLLHGGEHHEGRTAAKEEGCYCQRSTRSFIDSLIENHPQIWRKRRKNVSWSSIEMASDLIKKIRARAA